MDVQMFGCLMVKTRDFRYLKPILDGLCKNGPQPDLLIWQHVILNAPDRATRLRLLNDMRKAGWEPDERMWQQLARRNVFATDLN